LTFRLGLLAGSNKTAGKAANRQTDIHRPTARVLSVNNNNAPCCLPARLARLSPTLAGTCSHPRTQTANALTRTQDSTKANTHARTNTRTHAPTHALTHSHTHSHTHTRTRSLSLSLSLSLSHDLYKHMRTHKQTRKHRGVCLALSLLLVLLSQQEQYSEKKRMKNLLQSAPECNSSQHQDTAPGHSTRTQLYGLNDSCARRIAACTIITRVARRTSSCSCRQALTCPATMRSSSKALFACRNR
jgi:hypothetical protein